MFCCAVKETRDLAVHEETCKQGEVKPLSNENIKH